MSNVDPKDNQPLSSGPKRKNRRYVPGEWAPVGAGGGHPKLAGGFSIDLSTGELAPNGLNRPRQTYELTQTECQIRRAARAAEEYETTAVCYGSEGRFEVRGPSGNNYDVNEFLLRCDCPDWLKQDNSGYGLIRCKHIHIVLIALSDPLLPNGVYWGVAKFAQVAGCSERAAQHLCSQGYVDAFKFNGVWLIDPVDGLFSADLWKSRVIEFPNMLGGE